MAISDLLTQEEIDTLLQEVATGSLGTDETDDWSHSSRKTTEFAIHEHIVRGPLPTLEMIYDRFTRHFNSSMFGLLSRDTRVDLAGVETMKFADFVARLPLRCSLSVTNAETLPGVLLFVLESRVISSFVDGFFGGSAGNTTDNSRTELTISELRIARMIIRAAVKDLKLSWEPVYELTLDPNITETNPYFLNSTSPTELIVIARFKIEIGSHQGEMQIAMPYSVIEPIRELLETGMHSDRSSKFSHWHEGLKNSLGEVRVDMKANLVETELSLADVLTLKAGDIIPVDIPEQIFLRVEGIPMFQGAFGVSRGHNSLMVTKAHYGDISADSVGRSD